MPLDEAIDLLIKDFAAVMKCPDSPVMPPSTNQESTAQSSSPIGNVNPGPMLRPEPDDPSFLAPSRHVATLLRMLADSRVLSVGELDELISFIGERRSRLTDQLAGGTSVAGTAVNSDTAIER